MTYVARPSRNQVRTVPCPACEAQPGNNCVGARDKTRESNHQERVDAFLKANPRWNA